jgi:hypothetical protein
MAEITMLPIQPHEAGGLEVVDTGVSMLGIEGPDWRCGHCNRLMIQTMKLEEVKVTLAYQCGLCGGLNLVPGQN